MGTLLSVLLVVSYFLLVYFTVKIAAATKKYAEVTESLLSESREAFKVNFFEQTINNGIKLARTKPDWLSPYLKVLYESIKGVDSELAEDFKSKWFTCTEEEWSEIKMARNQVLKAFPEGEESNKTKNDN